MNLREGTRRLALLFGAVGALLCGFASYVELQSVLEQRARYNRFEQLANSDAIRQEQKSWSLTLRYTPDIAIANLRKLPEDQQRLVIRSLTQDERIDLMARLKCAPPLPGTPVISRDLSNLSALDDLVEEFLALPRDQQLETLRKLSPGKQDKLLAEVKARRAAGPPSGFVLDSPDPFACISTPTDPPTSTLNKAGIRTVRWSNSLDVEAIETADGRTLYPTPMPAAWIYFLIALLPVFGYVIPWGAIRAIGWVAAGFVQQAN